MSTTMQRAAQRRDKAFFGHPAGLGWLSFAEFFERFSYYGMQGLLVLYMTHTLLNPGHIEHVLGFEPFRHLIESVYGKLSPGALASQVFGLYAGFVYLTPIGGGILADRFIGRTRAITIGALLMALGHFLMAFEVSFLIALLCLLIGVGCFKGNIASQVGGLYGDDDPRRADAFQVFLFSVQIAGIVTPLVCGTLGQKVGWDWGFGAAGVGMLIGLGVYLFGRRYLPPEAPIEARGEASGRRPLKGADWIKIAVLVALLPVLALALVGNQEIFNAYLIWAEKNYQLVYFGQTMPVTWILSFDSIISAVTIGLSVFFWRWWATRWTEPDEISKIVIGITLAAMAPVLLAAASVIVDSTGHKVGLGWALGFEILNDVGFANILPVGLALYSRAAPKGMTGILIGIYYLHLFMGNLLVGYLGGLLERMSGSSFWLLHAGLMAASAGTLILVRLAMGNLLAPSYDHPHPAVAEAAE